VLDNGSIIRATPDHKFMTETGEMVAIDEIFHNGLDLKWIDPKLSDHQLYSQAGNQNMLDKMTTN
jgi:hypothetical protein